MDTRRRGLFCLLMFGIILLALLALMEAFRLSLSILHERQAESRERDGQPRWLSPPERRP